ncbi:MAG: sporulation protein YqfD, partial [Clostridia bacterium]|nr:sporulation protein YqfD [Clostridia bacterium]
MAKNIGEIGDYIVGWREVDVVGYYVEEFLNLIKDEHVELWDVLKTDQCHVSFKVHSFATEKLLELAESKQSLREMEVTVGETNGLIEDILKYKLRSGLFVGFVFFAVMLVVMTSFIWKIEILGLTSLTEEVLLKSLENNGIFIGAMTSGHDFQQIKYNIIQEFDSIAYITVNIQGCKAVV